MNISVVKEADCIGKPLSRYDEKSLIIHHCFDISSHPDALLNPLRIVIVRITKNFVIAIAWDRDTFVHVRRFSELRNNQSRLGKEWPIFDRAFTRLLASHGLTPETYTNLIGRIIFRLVNHLIIDQLNAEGHATVLPSTDSHQPSAEDIRNAFQRGAKERLAAEEAMRRNHSSKAVLCRT